MKDCCDMRGFLTFTVLRLISKKSMSGDEIRDELEQRKGSRPSPGTIYPALKELRVKGLIASDKSKVYSLTKKGKNELKSACAMFCRSFYDVKEMFNCCK